MIIKDSVTIGMPIETEFDYIKTAANWRNDDFMLSLGKSICFGAGGSWSLGLNVSEFFRQLREGCPNE